MEVEREAIKTQRGFSLQADGAASARFLPCFTLLFLSVSLSFSFHTAPHSKGRKSRSVVGGGRSE